MEKRSTLYRIWYNEGGTRGLWKPRQGLSIGRKHAGVGSQEKFIVHPGVGVKARKKSVFENTWASGLNGKKEWTGEERWRSDRCRMEGGGKNCRLEEIWEKRNGHFVRNGKRFSDGNGVRKFKEKGERTRMLNRKPLVITEIWGRGKKKISKMVLQRS